MNIPPMNTLFGVACLGFLLLGVGTLAVMAVSRNDWKHVQVIERSPSVSSGKTASTSRQIIIDVEGAVLRSGLIRLDSDSRIQDALTAAGGLSAGADRTWVEKNINMAQKVSDGMKIYIPPQGAAEAPNSKLQTPQQTALISINVASIDELETLWGVGTTRAQSIADGRPYGSIDELVTKKILPRSVVEKNKGRISL